MTEQAAVFPAKTVVLEKILMAEDFMGTMNRSMMRLISMILILNENILQNRNHVFGHAL